ncbi:hypothetical protein Y032_0002g895 [Ancylostoma ceylanicum]|uniref:Uncharacterized protein n=1 Tax=Ancylostoma ceylanicum TaxID=53326 RepID=A0A016W2W8_9BILA|nr:hypothetical protein Y032_0002g895 [Ancylostoma ceylanicum]
MVTQHPRTRQITMLSEWIDLSNDNVTSVASKNVDAHLANGRYFGAGSVMMLFPRKFQGMSNGRNQNTQITNETCNRLPPPRELRPGMRESSGEVVRLESSPAMNPQVRRVVTTATLPELGRTTMWHR